MIYLNNAATSYPKPEEVSKAAANVLSAPPPSRFRSNWEYASEEYGTEPELLSGNIEQLCRENLARLFDIPSPDRIYFTSGATEALNLAILGFFRNTLPNDNEGMRVSHHGPEKKGRYQGKRACQDKYAGSMNDNEGMRASHHGPEKKGRYQGYKIVVTQTEHNAVLRTIYDGLSDKLAAGELYIEVVPCDESGYVDMDRMRSAVTEETAMVVVNHCSNVTGAVQDIVTIGQIAKANSAVYLVDASQSAGALPFSVREAGIDLLAFTGHKALFGMQGTGGLYIREGIRLRPVLFGGTGRDSAIMIPENPFYEVGTANLPGIASLLAGTDYVLKTGLTAINKKEKMLMTQLYGGLKGIPGVTVYAARQPDGTALSFNMAVPPSDIGYILAESYGIIVRTGLHCAPFIHGALGTEKEGTVRVSISCMNEMEDIQAFLAAVKEISEGLQ